jgi:hypothetical protein
VCEPPHDDPDILEYKARWARQMAEILEKEICRPLAEKTGRNIPPTFIGPILTSVLASRFLFSPLINRVNAESVDMIDTQLYTEMITNVLLPGITNPNWKLNSH